MCPGVLACWKSVCTLKTTLRVREHRTSVVVTVIRHLWFAKAQGEEKQLMKNSIGWERQIAWLEI